MNAELRECIERECSFAQSAINSAVALNEPAEYIELLKVNLAFWRSKLTAT